jgi:hypothetical protein
MQVRRRFWSTVSVAILVKAYPLEATRAADGTCFWIAETTVDGRSFSARSKHGAPNELARQLVADGIPDAPMEIAHAELRGTMSYRSFHAAAKWAFTEGAKGELRRAPYRGAAADLADRFKTVSRVIGSPKKGGEPLPEASEAPEDDEALPRSHAGGGLASR